MLIALQIIIKMSNKENALNAIVVVLNVQTVLVHHVLVAIKDSIYIINNVFNNVQAYIMEIYTN